MKQANIKNYVELLNNIYKNGYVTKEMLSNHHVCHSTIQSLKRLQLCNEGGYSIMKESPSIRDVKKVISENARYAKLRRQNKAQRKIDFPTQSNEVIKTKPIKPRRRSAKYQMNEVTNKSNLEISLLWGLIKISK